MIYLELLWVFFQIGILSFGGGYAVLPMINEMIVQQHGWMTPQQFIDVLTLSEMTPGPIAINAATFVGNQLLGVPGGIVATVGVVLPSLIIVLFLAYLFFRYREVAVVSGVVSGLRPAVVALIATAGMTILLTAFFHSYTMSIMGYEINVWSLAIFSLALYLMRKYSLDPIKIIMISGIIGLIVYSIVI